MYQLIEHSIPDLTTYIMNIILLQQEEGYNKNHEELEEESRIEIDNTVEVEKQ